MGILHRAENVEVFDRDLRKIHSGRSEEVVEWIIMNPSRCETVSVQGIMDLLSIDQYMNRYDAMENSTGPFR